MAALNIPLILWCVIVVTMTSVISIKLFRNDAKDVKQVSRQDINSECEDMIVCERES